MTFIELAIDKIIYLAIGFLSFLLPISSIVFFDLLIMYRLNKKFDGLGFGIFGHIVTKGLNKIFRR